jgi:hypothetical protein
MDGEAPPLLRDVDRVVVGQHVNHPIVQREQAVGDREPHGDGGEGLGQRAEKMPHSAEYGAHYPSATT